MNGAEEWICKIGEVIESVNGNLRAAQGSAEGKVKEEGEGEIC